MQIVLLLSLATLALASEFNMDFEEGGQNIVEKVKIDIAGNTEEISVPQHMDRAAVDELTDFSVGLTAQKFIAEKICYISKLESGREIPVQMQRSMLISKAKFPNSRFEVIKNSLLLERNMTTAEVGAKIAAHCQGNKLIKVLAVDESNMNEVATKMIRKQVQAMAGRSKRDVLVQNFVTCSMWSTIIVSSCRHPRKIGARCRYLPGIIGGCAVQVQCSLGSGGFLCRGAHIYSQPSCCDFTCT